MKTAAGSPIFSVQVFRGVGHIDWDRGWTYAAVYRLARHPTHIGTLIGKTVSGAIPQVSSLAGS